MKCICGSGANEEIEDLKSKFILALEGRNWRNRALERRRVEVEGLTADCQTLHIRNLELQGRVTALRELYGISIKNNTGLKAQITWLEDKLLEVRILASKSFSPSSRPSLQAKSQPDPE